MLIETILGGVTGLIGNVVGGIFKYKHAKLQKEIREADRKHEIAMVKVETQAMIMEAKANIKITQAQVEGAIEIEDAKAYMQSQKEGNKALFGQKWVDSLLNIEGSMFEWTDKAGKKKSFFSWKMFTVPTATLVAFLFGFVDFIRGFIRPALTVYLCGVTTWVTWMAWQIMEKGEVSLKAIDAVNIFQDTTSIVTYLTVSCVTWWFGDRRMAKTIMELKGADTKKMDDEIKI